MSFDLRQILKALLFSTASPISVKAIQSVFTRYHKQTDQEGVREERTTGEGGEVLLPVLEGSSGVSPDEVPSLVTATRIRDAIDEINRELDACGEVYHVVEGHQGYQLVIRAEHALWVRLLRDEPREVKLSQAALETLAIVAYRQPATRAEMESIRGVSVDGALSRLIERELVVVEGRADLPGRPIQYGTSERFLEFVGIRSLDELPASDVLSPRQIDEWIQKAAEADEQAPRDRDVGLPEEN
ncbi:MAG: SMC-Scp complex subunit ScpB, partial [Opitutales bacterium]